METSFPDGIAKRHGNLRSFRGGKLRLLPLALLLAIGALGLSGFLGGGNRGVIETSNATVKVSVETPITLRSGEYFERQIGVTAMAPVADLSIAFSRGLLEGFTLNSTTPQPERESSEDGRYVFSFGALDAGQSFTAQTALQANPNNVGEAKGEIIVRDGDAELVRLPLRIMVLP